MLRRRWWCLIRPLVVALQRKKPSDDCMSNSVHTAAHAFEADHLPVWWRCVLIALATIILCSCSSPMTRSVMGAERTALSADESVDAATKQSLADCPAVVIRDNS